MCKCIEDTVKSIITNAGSRLKCANGDWNVGNVDGFIIRKNVIHNNDYKYVEYTKWEENKPTCIAIGFNPATANVNEIDETNNKIIEQLKNRYGAYVLLNLYPQVSKDKKHWQDDDGEDEKYEPVLYQIIDDIIASNEHVLIFWGRSVAISEKLNSKLKRLIEQERLLITVKQGTKCHYHPARVSIEIKQADDNTLTPSYTIK
jgi:hypothetical protein